MRGFVIGLGVGLVIGAIAVFLVLAVQPKAVPCTTEQAARQGAGAPDRAKLTYIGDGRWEALWDDEINTYKVDWYGGPCEYFRFY